LPVIGPLQTGTWGILAAAPGVGTSMWLAMLTKAIASNKFGRAGSWMAPTRRTVLLIDAEMSPQEIASRYADADFGDYLGICSLDLLERLNERPFSLGNDYDQAQLFAAAEPFDVILIDNIEYTLEPAAGHNIWAPETWAQVEPITRWAKSRNKLLIFVDHLNKEGGVQGSLAKQRGASFVIKLEPEYVERAQVAFTHSFSKLRYLVDDPLLKRNVKWWLIDSDWYTELSLTKKEQVINLGKLELKPKQIAKEVGLSERRVYEILRKNKHLLN